MTKYISLFGATTTDTQVQVVKENQVIIGIGAGASRKRYVVYKVEHTARGYVYHMVDTETKEISQTDILRPLSQTFGIGRYYDDVNPEFMDAFEVALLVRQAEEQATAQAIAAAKEKAEHDRIAEIGAQRLRRIMPEGVQGVIIAELNETEYTDPSYECSTTRSVRTVILGFSATSRNGFGELRKAAANFPQTAHLSEYDPKNEHRYPVFTLGKSPKYGWSVCKLTHYTREGYIDRLAYIAGNEENICLPEPKDEKRAERTETSVQGGFIIVDYSEKAIAVFGDTKPVKDALHALGGRFNARLTHDGQKKAGWIFQKTKEDEVRRLLGKDELMLNTGWLAAPQYQKIMAQGTDYFKLTIQNYLDARAREDELFAPRYANPKKNIDDCCTFIINQVRQSGCNGFADEEIYSMALHYYDEEDIDIGKPVSCKVVVNHTVELTEEEKAEARRNAIRKAESEAYAKLAKAKSKPKKIEDNKLMPSLF